MTKRQKDAGSANAKHLLQAGIAAMKARQIPRARSLLMRAVAENENDARAWLCLSRVLRNPAAQKACLEKALDLDPTLPADNLLSSTRRRLAARLTKQGVAAARAGQQRRARALLKQAVAEDSGNPTAWLWLSKTARRSEDRTACRRKANSLKSSLRSGLRTGRRPQAPSRASQRQPVTPTRSQLAALLPVACVSLAGALILGLTLGLVRNVLARPTSSAPAAVQDGDTKTSTAVVSVPAQPAQGDGDRPTAIPTKGSTATTSSPSAVEATLEGQPTPLQPSRAYTPTRIVVSSVGVDAPVVPIALVTAGEDASEARWEVPEPDVAGWHETSAPLGISGNTVINGHNWPQEAVFRDLHKIEPGEAIAVYADELGFAYEVTEVVLLPEQGQSWEVQLANTHYIDPTDDDRLTIITCHPYGSVRYRLVVVALRTELAQPDGS